MSAQRRRAPAPLPIFNKGKRPRRALIAHPNNVGGPAHAQQPAQAQWKSNYAPSPWLGDFGSFATNSQYRGPQCNYPTRPPQPFVGQQENQLPGLSRDSQDHQRAGFTPYQAGQWQSGQTSQRCQSPLFPEERVPEKIQKQQTMQGPKLTLSSGVPSPRPKPSKGSVRVLTATAKGMEHWSRYKHLTQMIFEVFGVLCTTVTVGNMGAKEFTLKTSDGPVKCVFWEMDRNLPHLVRGHTHRVVGLWDCQKRFLKCYSVRPAQPKEEECAGAFVRASDHSMREAIASTHEN